MCANRFRGEGPDSTQGDSTQTNQYFKSSYNSNYENDDGHIINFLSKPKEKKYETIPINQCTVSTMSSKENIHIDNAELNILYKHFV